MKFATKHLTVKPMMQEDKEQLLNLLTDEIVGKTYMLPQHASREEAQQLAYRLIKLSQDPSRYVSGIYRQECLIGIVNETDVTDQKIEIGYALLPEFHNRGYATECLSGAIEYLFDRGFKTVTAGAFSDNAASIRVMEKFGMVRQAEVDWIEYRGKQHRCVYYSASR